MVVVAIIGLLAAAGLPGYRHIVMRSKISALENDLRQFAAVIQNYTLQNGKWPADANPSEVPPEVAGAMPSAFAGRSPIGGVYKWNFGIPADGLPVKAAIVVVSVTNNPVTDDVELFEMVDRQIDDGKIDDGDVQRGSTGSLIYVIEK